MATLIISNEQPRDRIAWGRACAGTEGLGGVGKPTVGRLEDGNSLMKVTSCQGASSA